jgi:hypothetical protein
MRLVLSEGVTLKNTWGYKNYQENNTVHYYVSTLHNRDYETIFAKLSPNPTSAGLGSFYVDYFDLENNQKTLGPYEINLVPPAGNANQHIADARVREAEGILTLACGLIDIANKTEKIAGLERELYQYADPSPQRMDVVQQIMLECSQNIEIAGRLTDYLSAISESLGGGKYEKEIEILQNYTRTFTNVYDSYADKNKTQ